MNPEGKDPFKRSGRVMRSPPHRSLSLPEHQLVDIDVEQGESSRKRKEITPPQKAAKKATGEDPESSGDEAADVFPTEIPGGELDYLRRQFAELKKISAGMTKWATGQYKSKKILISQQNEIVRNMESLSALTNSLEMKMSYLQGRLDERTKIKEAYGSGPGGVEPSRPPTFAEKVKIPKVTGITKIQTPQVLFVKSKDENQTTDEIKNVIKSTIRPSQMGLNIRRVTKTARGVLIETEGPDQLEKLAQCQALKDKGLVFDKPKKRNPRVMIYDVEMPEDPQIFVEDVHNQNFRDSNIDLETFRREFKCVHRYKKKDQQDLRVSLVIECSARVRNLIRSRDRVYIGWQSCRLKDYNPLVRCFKCQSFGHVAKYCRGKNTCSHCAEEHEFTACPNKGHPPKCANCVAAKRDPDHSLSSPKCLEFIRATKIAYERVDYGN